MADGVEALAQLHILYSDWARSFNRWQGALYPNFIINKVGSHHKCKKCFAHSDSLIWNIHLLATEEKNSRVKSLIPGRFAVYWQK